MCRNVAMIKSSKDIRYAKDSVVTHDGMKFPCWALPDLSSFRQKFGDDAYEKVILQLKTVNVCLLLKSNGLNSISKEVLRDEDCPWLINCTIQ